MGALRFLSATFKPRRSNPLGRRDTHEEVSLIGEDPHHQIVFTIESGGPHAPSLGIVNHPGEAVAIAYRLGPLQLP